MSQKKSSLTYKQAGVDVASGEDFVRLIKPLAQKTRRREVLSSLGGFAGLFKLNTARLKDPVLVSGTDGVGTKLKIAFLADQHDTIGIDLVAMCANDVVVTGAEPLFFLDYLATGRLDPVRASKVVRGIAKGCQEAGCALLGGETAEMPSMYTEGEYDLAGFCVGVAEKAKLMDGSGIRPGDQLIGLASSGLHSNGYSLVRKIVFETLGLGVSDRVAGLRAPLGKVLLTPTRIYVKAILSLLKDRALAGAIKGISHITGGGIHGNLPRILPKGCRALLDSSSWSGPPIFHFLAEQGNISQAEMFRTFNMGLGMILAVEEKKAEKIMLKAEKLGERAFHIGEVVRGAKGVTYA